MNGTLAKPEKGGSKYPDYFVVKGYPNPPFHDYDSPDSDDSTKLVIIMKRNPNFKGDACWELSVPEIRHAKRVPFTPDCDFNGLRVQKWFEQGSVKTRNSVNAGKCCKTKKSVNDPDFTIIPISKFEAAQLEEGKDILWLQKIFGSPKVPCPKCCRSFFSALLKRHISACKGKVRCRWWECC